MIRIGYGYDIHRLAEGRRLVLGGVTIPFEKGLDGHSDADVLLHAIIDALLGAVALGDIGHQFPDTDFVNKDADSRVLLRKTASMIRNNGYLVGNIDSTVVAERPGLQPYISKMRAYISSDLNISIDSVSIKATTSEKMGMVGRQEGICAMAICLLIPSNQEG